MEQIFETADLVAPYDNLVFPGKAEDERILYVTRESPIMLGWRLFGFSTAVAVATLVGAILVSVTGRTFNFDYGGIVLMLVLLGGVVLFGGLWWMREVYTKTMFIITTRRLTKFIHTTPWNRYQLSLGLDKVEDSGAYSKGYLQAMFKLGTFVARSSAGNIKNFKIENIAYAEDLHNWMNKLMFIFGKEQDKLDSFRPFVARGVGQRGE